MFVLHSLFSDFLQVTVDDMVCIFCATKYGSGLLVICTRKWFGCSDLSFVHRLMQSPFVSVICQNIGELIKTTKTTKSRPRLLPNKSKKM